MKQASPQVQNVNFNDDIAQSEIVRDAFVDANTSRHTMAADVGDFFGEMRGTANTVTAPMDFGISQG